MKTQRGVISTGLVALIAVLSIVFVTVAFVVLSYVDAYDKGVRYEQEIKAAWENNEQILGNFKVKLQNSIGTSKLNAQQVTQLVEAANKARYGGEGSKASWQWIQENNLALDQSVNKQILQVVEAGQDEFKAAQTRMISTKQSYSTAIEKQYLLGEGWWLDMAGFPKIKLADYKTISSEGAQEAFKTGVDKPADFGLEK